MKDDRTEAQILAYEDGYDDGWERANELVAVLDWELKSTKADLESTKEELHAERLRNEGANYPLFSAKIMPNGRPDSITINSEWELKSTKEELEWTKIQLDFHKSLLVGTKAKYKSRLDMTKQELESTKQELDSTMVELHAERLRTASTVEMIPHYIPGRTRPGVESEDDEG